MALCTDWSVSGIIWPSLPSTTITSQDSLTSGLFVYSCWNLGGLSNNVIQTSISTHSKILVNTLGGEGSASTYVPGARQEVEDELAIRRLTFWCDGFTVEDGPLMRYDDPANADVLATIHAGHAPPSILNDDYVPPPAKPFSGAGNRLGAPTSAPSASVARAAPVPAPASSASINPCFEVDTTQPGLATIALSLGLCRTFALLIACMNLTHTVGNLRGFIDVARPAGRAYTIGTTFPTCVLNPAGDTCTVKEAGLGGVVVVQSWA
ncbi:hypothetical protein B0H14DRAFT_3689452 [Mycena olivaceomarginata]|nr:hypothetical protein B0H14DRAFT_3689452 [Mycena olivaceomarginata]